MLAELERETSDNAGQQVRIAELRRLYSDWKSIADQALGEAAVRDPRLRTAW